MFSLKARIVTAKVVQPMGKSQNPSVARPLLFSPMKGRDARTRVSPNIREQVLSLAGRDREGLATLDLLTDPPRVPVPQTLPSYATRTPAMVAVSQEARAPPRTARRPRAAISLRLDGAMPPMPPI